VNRIWHAVLAAVAAFALVGSTVLVVRNDGSLLNTYSYFTVQANAVVMVGAGLVAWRPDLGGTAFGILRMAGLVSITITGIVFSTVLAGTIELAGLEQWNDRIFHYLVPAMAVIGFVAFTPRTRLDRSAWWFIAWPVAWLAYTLVRGSVASPGFRGENGTTMDVPYDFLDADRHGTVSVAVAALVVTALALGIAWGYRWLSQRDSAVSVG